MCSIAEKYEKKNWIKNSGTLLSVFYFDGTGFMYKTNPMDQEPAPTAREWRLPNEEGLYLGCTAKGRKEGETQAKFMVAISYNRGVVMCQQYSDGISGDKFARIVDKHFPQAFNLSINQPVR